MGDKKKRRCGAVTSNQSGQQGVSSCVSIIRAVQNGVFPGYSAWILSECRTMD